MTHRVGHRDPGRPPLLWGHRGVRQGAPENTMAAFTLAVDQGADGIELDVRPSSHGELVVLHDPKLTRVTGGRDRRGIHEVSVGELARIELMGGERVPRLDDVLAWALERGRLVNVELKRDVPDRRQAVRGLVRSLRRFPSAGDSVIVSSFDPFLLLAFRALAPSINVGFLFHVGQRLWQPWTAARALPVHAVHPEAPLVTSDHVNAVRARGRSVNVWTVNDPAEARRLAALGVDGIITDVPGVIRQALEPLK